MRIVARREAAVPARKREEFGGLPPEVFDRSKRTLTTMPQDVFIVPEERPVQHDISAVGSDRLQTQLADQLTQRVVADRVIGVAFGDSCLVERWCGVESEGSNLAARHGRWPRAG